MFFKMIAYCKRLFYSKVVEGKRERNKFKAEKICFWGLGNGVIEMFTNNTFDLKVFISFCEERFVIKGNGYAKGLRDRQVI